MLLQRQRRVDLWDFKAGLVGLVRPKLAKAKNNNKTTTKVRYRKTQPLDGGSR